MHSKKARNCSIRDRKNIRFSLFWVEYIYCIFFFLLIFLTCNFRCGILNRFSFENIKCFLFSFELLFHLIHNHNHLRWWSITTSWRFKSTLLGVLLDMKTITFMNIFSDTNQVFILFFWCDHCFLSITFTNAFSFVMTFCSNNKCSCFSISKWTFFSRKTMYVSSEKSKMVFNITAHFF